MTDTGFVVRRAGPADAAAWRELRLRALADSPTAFGATLEHEQQLDTHVWADRLAAGNSVIALVGDVPVGIGAGFGDLPGWFHLVSIWVAPPFRRRGINAGILQALVERADELGLRVHIDVTRGNDVARHAYERFGFSVTGETAALREGSPYVVERMVLPG
ncbi:MAG TPA: GNAT family N-acetyltransferase [Marmoricola sp.]|nr:GNAT family N-acetyltransferase [Marmoricola sp.]